jgi:outer membrane protein OmpA-like peptidoglycan-associated protein/tetratricopeptide (TPR) repeat protein
MNRHSHFHRLHALGAFALVALFTFSSCNSRYFWKGLRAYEKKQYPTAVSSFQQACEQWPNDTMALRMLGRSQLIVGDHASSARSFEELELRANINTEDRQNWASALMNESKFFEASDILQPLLIANEVNGYARELWNNCQRQLQVIEDTRHWEVQTLHFPQLETASSPRISGDKLYFSSESWRWGETDHYARLDRNETWTMDLKSSTRQVMKAADVEIWDLPAHDGMVNVAPNGRSIAYSKKNPDGLGWFGDPQVGGFQLLIASRTASGGWSESRPFPFVEKGYVFAHPTWSPDGTKIYFASNIPSPESQGGMDLWVSERNGTFWEEPLNLGPEVNSSGDDVFPALDNNGRLYFASDGHPSLGGMDVFWTEIDPTVESAQRHWRDGDAWKKPTRMGFPINTLADDFSYAPYNDGSAFVCSNRSGRDQVYRLQAIDNSMTVDIQTTDRSSGIALPQVTIRWIDTRDGSAWDVRTDLNGTASIVLPPNRGYRVEASAPGYILEKNIITTTEESSQWPIEMAKVHMLNDVNFASKYMGGTPFQLAAIEWSSGSTQLSRKGQLELNELADFLKLNPDVFMEIRAHEDASKWDKSDETSNRLSKNRGIQLETGLLRRGVSSKQLLSLGKGVSELTNDCNPGEPCAYYSHEENERIEFRIYGLLQQVPGQIDATEFSKD